MTPLIERAVHALVNWSGPWNAQAIGVTSPRGFLSAISASKVFVVDEAEEDTTVARDLHPGYFASTTGFYLPAPVCWYEYKVYAPVGNHLVSTGLRSAFLATTDETGGIAVFLISEVPGLGLGVMPGFGFDKTIERSPVVVEGQPMHLRLPAGGDDCLPIEKVGECSSFFLEMVELVNMPVGVLRREESAPRQFRKRLARAMGRLDFDLAPVTHITLDLPELSHRAFGGVA